MINPEHFYKALLWLAYAFLMAAALAWVTSSCSLLGVPEVSEEGKKKVRRLVDAASGCYVKEEKVCESVITEQKRLLFGTKVVPVQRCVTKPVRYCPGDRGYRK